VPAGERAELVGRGDTVGHGILKGGLLAIARKDTAGAFMTGEFEGRSWRETLRKPVKVKKASLTERS